MRALILILCLCATPAFAYDPGDYQHGYDNGYTGEKEPSISNFSPYAEGWRNANEDAIADEDREIQKANEPEKSPDSTQ